MVPSGQQPPPEHRPPRQKDESGSAPLELVLVAPALVLLVVFVLWAGRAGRAGLVTDLAAGEAAVVASLYSDDPADDAERETVVQEVLSARPGLDFLCIGGAKPRALDAPGEFVDEAWLEGFEPEVAGAARGVGAVGVRLECRTDGAVAPLRGVLPAVSFYGQASEVIAIPPRPQLSVAMAEADEGNPGDTNKLVFLIELTAPFTQDVNINYNTNVGATNTATANIDYTPLPSSTLTILAGEVSKTVEVDINADSVYEHDETLVLEWELRPATPSDACLPGFPMLTNPVSATAVIQCDLTLPDYGWPVDLGTGAIDLDYWEAVPAIGTINNDDARPTLSVPPVLSVAENASSIDVTVSLDAPTGVAVGYEYHTADVTAVAGIDYTPLGTPLVPISASMAADELSPPTDTITVIIVNDPNNAEPDETFELNLALVADSNGVTHAVAGNLTTEITITDDEPTVAVSGNPGTAIEGNTLNFDITVSPAPTTATGSVTVNYEINPGTAHAGADYSILSPHSTTGTLTFAPGLPATQTISVSAIDDTIDEDLFETFTVELTGSSANARITSSSATGTIEDNDSTPTLVVGDASVAEGSTLAFDVKLVDAGTGMAITSSSNVTVQYSAVDSDTVSPVSDATATPDDYTVNPAAQLVIPAGDSTATIQIEAVSDSNNELDEHFYLNFTSALNAQLDTNPLVDPAAQTVKITIQNTTGRSFSIDDPSAAEGHPLDFTVTLIDGNTMPTSSAILIDYEIVEMSPPGAATEAVDYETPSSIWTGQLDFQPGDFQKTITVDAVLDTNFPEGDETFQVRLIAVSGYDVSFTKEIGTGTIEDFEPPELAINPAHVAAEEGQDLEFNVELNAASDWDTEFDVYTFALKATPGQDYQDSLEDPARSRRTIPAGATQTQVTVTTLADNALDDNETLQLRLANPENAFLGSPSIAVGTIEDVIAAVVSVADAEASEGEAVGFVVSLNIEAPTAIEVNYRTIDGDAVAGPQGVGDYEHTQAKLTFDEGDTEKIVLVQTWPDSVDEFDETFFLELSNPTGDARLGDDTAEGTIKPRQSSLSIADASADEGNDVVFTVTRTGATDLAVTVDYATAALATADRPASGGFPGCSACDYYTTTGTLEFGPEELVKTITVPTRPDSDATETPDEQFRMDLSNSENADFDRATAIGTIREGACADPRVSGSSPPAFRPAPVTISEGVSTSRFQIQLDPALCSNTYWVDVVVGSAGDTAQPNVDFGGAGGRSGPVRIYGADLGFNNISIFDDSLDEDDETVTAVVTGWRSPASNNLNYPGTPGRLTAVTLTIVDNDDPPVVNVLNARGIEGQALRFAVQLDRPSGREVRVPYFTRQRSAGSNIAQEDIDYIGIPETSPHELVFAPGQTEMFASVFAELDSVPEADETFQLILGEPTSSTDPTFTRGVFIAEGTIVDGQLPGLSITSNYEATGNKVAEGAAEQFTVTLDRASTDSVTVFYGTNQVSGPNAAVAFVDFINRQGQVDFNAGEVEKTFSISTLPDDVVEGDERFQVELWNPINAVLADPVAETVIGGQCANPLDANQDLITVTIDHAEVGEGDRVVYHTMSTDVPLCTGAIIGVDMAFDFSNSIAESADFDRDYFAPVWFSPNRPFETFPVYPEQDTLPEDDETYEIVATWRPAASGGVTLPAQYNGSLAGTGTGTIIDDDTKVEVSIGNATGPEGGTLSFPVRLSKVADRDISVDYETKAISGSSNAATPGTDFIAISKTQLTIHQGEIGGIIEVSALRDNDEGEGDEKFLVELSSPVPEDFAAIDVAIGEGTILDAVTPKVDVSNASADEGQVLEFQVTLDRESAELVTVQYTTVEGTATEGVDYLPASGVLRFAPGETAKTVSVAALADNSPLEGDETLRLELSNPASARLGDWSGLGTIHNLGVPEISVGDSSATEGSSVLFEISLGNRANRDITVDYTTVPRTSSGDVAATPGDDYNPVSGTVTITAGSTAATVAVSTVDDRLDEYSEAFGLEVANPDFGNLADGNATGTIVDNDAEPELSVDAAFATENAGPMQVVVRLDQASGRSVAVDFALSDGSATAGDDYVDDQGTLTISAGQLTTTLEVELLDDDEAEGAETFTIGLADPLNATLGGSGTAELTIIDDEGLPTIYAEPQPGGTVEGGLAQITLRLSHQGADPVSVSYRTGGGDAAAGSDYEAVPLTTTTFAPGELDKTLSTSTIDDTEVEDLEHFDWLFSNVQNAQLAQSSSSSWILDNDGVAEVTVDDASVTEGGVARFAVRLTSPAADPVTVDYEAEADAFAGALAAEPGQDFTEVTGTVSIAAGDQTAWVEVPVPEDELNEGTETFWLRLGATTGADVRDALAVGTIHDDDPLPSLSIHEASAVEGDALRFAVRLSEPSGRIVRVGYVPEARQSEPEQSRATPVRDFDAAAKTLVIPAGVTEAIAEVDAALDRISEYEETFLVRLFNPTHAVIADSTAVGTIIDSNDLPRASIADTEAVEGSGPARFAVTLSHPSSSDITVLYSTADGTAEADDDYTGVTDRTVTIPADATAQTIEVALIDDATAEPDEIFTVELRSPTGATLIDDSATGTIIDDDGLPRFTIGDSQAGEGDGSLEFTVALSHASAQATTVQYATFDNTATQPQDYTVASGTLIFDAGTVTQTVEVPISNDLLDEADETITVRLSNPSGNAVLRGPEAAATGTIVDDDPEPNLRLFGATADEGDPLAFTAILDAPSGQAVTVEFATADGTAEAASGDYFPASGTLTFPPGTITQNIPVTTRLDAYTEAPETMRLDLSNPRYAAVVASHDSATGTIRNQELPAITVADASALEGDPIVFNISLNRPSDTDAVVSFRITDADTTGNQDYRVPSFSRVAIPAGRTQTQLVIQTLSDTRIEADESFLLILTSVVGNAQIQDASAVGTILENALSATISVDDPQTPEGGAATFTVTLSRDANTAETPISISYYTNPLSATQGVDYTAATGRLDFPASTTTQQLTVSVPTTDDELPETAETFQLVLHNPEGDAVMDDSTGTATILDDDLEPTLSIDPAETDEGSPVIFTATLDAPSGREITADFSTSGITATEGVDYIARAGTLVFPVGTTSQTIAVATLPDQLVEEDETLELTLSNLVGAVPGTDGTGTIIDATQPNIRITGGSAQEGDPIVFTISLNQQSDAEITVDYQTSDDTAIAGADYRADSGTIRFPPGTTQQSVSITTHRDSLDENDETFHVTLRNATGGAKVRTDTASGTIQNAAQTIISVSDLALGEDDGWQSFTVRLSRPADQPVTVQYQTIDGTATTDADFRAVTGTTTFSPGTTRQQISVLTLNDAIDEDHETFTLELSNPTGGADFGPGITTITAIGTIYDADPLPRILAYRFDPVRIREDEGSMALRLDRQSSREITVDWATAERDVQGEVKATEGEDYLSGSGTASFPPMEREAVIQIDIIDDQIWEPPETFSIDLSNPTNAELRTTNPGSSNFLGWQAFIEDNEPAIVKVLPGSAVEGDNVEFLITTNNRGSNLANPLRTIQYQLVSGTAEAGSDFTDVSGTFTMPQNYDNWPITVPTTADSEAEGSEWFELHLFPSEYVGIQTETVIKGTIIDEQKPVVSIYAVHADTITPHASNIYADQIEGSRWGAGLHVELDAASTHDITVNYQITGGTGSSSDYVSGARGTHTWPSGSVTIPAGDTSLLLLMWFAEDTVYEVAEDIQVQISSPDDVYIGQDTASYQIIDTTGSPILSVADAVTIEGSTMQFTVLTDGKTSTFETTVEYRTIDSTALAGVHYTPRTGTLTIPAGDSEGTIDVPTLEDSDLLGDKVFYLELSNPINAEIERDTATGRIVNNDCVDLARGDSPPMLRLAPASAQEGENLDFTVTIGKPFCDDIAQAITITTSLGTASVDDATTPSAVVGFKAGETEAVYSGVLAIEDSLDEPDETVIAEASWHPSMPAVYQSEPAVSAAGTINDDDDEPSLRVVDAASAEAGTLAFIVTLDAPSGKQITVDYATTTAGNAIAGVDYSATSGSLDFAPGETVKQVVVQSLPDALDEHDERFHLQLSNPANALLGDPIGVGTINDDDPLPEVSIADSAADEDDLLRFTITLSIASGRDVYVVYTTADGTATTADDDYTATTAIARIPPGNTTTTIQIATQADSTQEPDETFSVSLVSSSPDNTLHTENAVISSTSHTATGTIRNDD